MYDLINGAINSLSHLDEYVVSLYRQSEKRLVDFRLNDLFRSNTIEYFSTHCSSLNRITSDVKNLSTLSTQEIHVK